jgi:hypothetical protein
VDGLVVELSAEIVVVSFTAVIVSVFSGTVELFSSLKNPAPLKRQ